MGELKDLSFKDALEKLEGEVFPLLVYHVTSGNWDKAKSLLDSFNEMFNQIKSIVSLLPPEPDTNDEVYKKRVELLDDDISEIVGKIYRHFGEYH